VPNVLPTLAIAADHHWPRRPSAVAPFLAIMDDPANYPVLIHCRAGLHRTGIYSAIYRMEYQGWSRDAAIRELRDNGFGDSQCNSQNQYILQYLLIYEPRNPSEGQFTSSKQQAPNENPITSSQESNGLQDARHGTAQ
jgi:protein-tyrosine phosphatase